MSDIKHQINVIKVRNSVAREGEEQEVYAVMHTQKNDIERFISEMMEVNPGLEKENLQMSVHLMLRVMKDKILRGEVVNLGLFSVRLKCRGAAGADWDPERNSLYAGFTQSEQLRKEIQERTAVTIVANTRYAMNITDGRDIATGKDGFTATAGGNFLIRGKNIKLAGDDPEVGITLTSADGKVTRFTPGLIATNLPSQVMISIPPKLEEGEYLLKLTTRYTTNTKRLLKVPKTCMRTLFVRRSSE